MRSVSILMHAMAVVLMPAAAFSQGFDGLVDASHPLVGVGTAELKRPASQMVALFSLKATGTNIREATAALEKAADEAKAKILELGASEDSIRLEAIRLHQETEDASRRMMSQMRFSTDELTVTPDAEDGEAAAKELVTVATTIRGTWNLEGNSPSEVLASSWELQKSIQKAEVIPQDTQEGLSPEEQELLDEARMFDNSGGDAASNAPVFVFANSVTPAERAQLLKDAFQKATENARETAGIIGRAPGSPVNIRITSEDADSIYGMDRYQMSNYEIVGQFMQELKSENPLVMIGLSPSELDYQVSVKCGFELTNGK